MKRKVLELRPTQFALGMREVQRKVEKLRAMGHGERSDYLHERLVRVVLAAHGRVFIVDHHHHARACWELGIEEVPVAIEEDYSRLSVDAFWDKMRASGWAHLYDQFGRGPHPPQLLPEDVRGMADDRYRSLAWALRLDGVFEKTEEAFAEFRWADFLRAEVVVGPGDEGFRKAVADACEAVRSPKAKALPGYLGKK